MLRPGVTVRRGRAALEVGEPIHRKVDLKGATAVVRGPAAGGVIKYDKQKCIGRFYGALLHHQPQNMESRTIRSILSAVDVPKNRSPGGRDLGMDPVVSGR
eukprot:1144292-Prorocentrum_minimum.AAC.1